VRDRDDLKPHLKWADAVVWLAALVGDPACALHPEVSVEINDRSVKWLAETFNGRIIFLSTCSVYGAQDGVLDESSSTNPLSVYAVTKLKAEEHLADRNALIFRLGTLFGVGDLFSRIRLDLVVNTLAVRAHRQGKITVYGGDQFRPLLHVKDAARAIVENLESKERGIFNLNKQNVRIIDLAYQVRNHFPDLVMETTEMKFQDLRNYRVNGDKAAKLLGFKPRSSIDDGIEEIKALLEYGRLRDVDNPRYTNSTFLSLHNTHLQSNR
jgi:nucleoside-diphosphate-sugar epimerase